MSKLVFALALVCSCAFVSGTAQGDPCGMVPPIYSGPGDPITRVGPQKTYVFYKNGVESIALRPGFSGKVDNFGMLIPFPTPPAIRKVPDEIFSQIAAAVDPPEIRVWFRRYRPRHSYRKRSMAPSKSAPGGLRLQGVRVLRQEAVGMYQVAVLEAGSAKALQRWMDRNGYKYPKGMDKPVLDYIRAGWCFVAVKTRVAGKQGLSPRPGMRSTKTRFPKGGNFDGKVQAMGFRFKTKRLVVPMRLSAFNKGRLRNVVYLLADGPHKIHSIPTQYVRRQLSGAELYRNVTELLPLRVIGGLAKDLPRHRWDSIQRRRNPTPHNGLAKELFASDLLAVATGRLALPHEEQKKVLLRIGERLGLRGKIIDQLNRAALASEREDTVRRGLSALKQMTLTVIDGDFPRELLARENLSFEGYRMPKNLNTADYYDARKLSVRTPQTKQGNLTRWQGPKWSRPKGTPTLKRPTRRQPLSGREFAALIGQLDHGKTASEAVRKLVAQKGAAVPYLFGEVLEQGNPLPRRGWSVVALAEIGGKLVLERLSAVYDASALPMIVRTWAAAAKIRLAASLERLIAIKGMIHRFPATRRPFLRRLASLVQKKRRGGLTILLDLAFRDWAFRQKLAPMIVGYGVKPLLAAMVHDKTNGVRRLAAGYLGGLASKDYKTVARMVIDAYRFRRGAKAVSWHGGALFLPSLRWTPTDARRLVHNLIQWMVWAEFRGDSGIHRQLHNNLRSLSLAQVAGYRSPGWSTASASTWLSIWGGVIGCRKLKTLLGRQNALRSRRYQQVLTGLHCK